MKLREKLTSRVADFFRATLLLIAFQGAVLASKPVCIGKQLPLVSAVRQSACVSLNSRSLLKVEEANYHSAFRKEVYSSRVDDLPNELVLIEGPFGISRINFSGMLRPCLYDEGSSPLILKVDTLYGERVVKVSFNGVSSGAGLLSIVDASNKVIYTLSEMDLSPEPYFYAIKCDQLPTGTYTFYVKTKTAIYKAVIKI